eukprot:Selendium_serpulae@DN6470_c2_g1_i13.p1
MWRTRTANKAGEQNAVGGGMSVERAGRGRGQEVQVSWDEDMGVECAAQGQQSQHGQYQSKYQRSSDSNQSRRTRTVIKAGEENKDSIKGGEEYKDSIKAGEEYKDSIKAGEQN